MLVTWQWQPISEDSTYLSPRNWITQAGIEPGVSSPLTSFHSTGRAMLTIREQKSSIILHSAEPCELQQWGA